MAGSPHVLIVRTRPAAGLTAGHRVTPQERRRVPAGFAGSPIIGLRGWCAYRLPWSIGSLRPAFPVTAGRCQSIKQSDCYADRTVDAVDGIGRSSGGR